MYSFTYSINILSTYSKLGTAKVPFSNQISSPAYWGGINNHGKHLMTEQEKLPFMVPVDQEFQSSWTGSSISGSLMRAQAVLTAAAGIRRLN